MSRSPIKKGEGERLLPLTLREVAQKKRGLAALPCPIGEKRPFCLNDEEGGKRKPSPLFDRRVSLKNSPHDAIEGKGKKTEKRGHHRRVSSRRSREMKGEKKKETAHIAFYKRGEREGVGWKHGGSEKRYTKLAHYESLGTTGKGTWVRCRQKGGRKRKETIFWLRRKREKREQNLHMCERMPKEKLIS